MKEYLTKTLRIRVTEKTFKRLNKAVKKRKLENLAEGVRGMIERGLNSIGM